MRGRLKRLQPCTAVAHDEPALQLLEEVVDAFVI